MFLCGCSGGVSENEPSTADVESYETPEDVFAAAIAAGERDDWESFASMLTAESQAKMAASLIGGAKFEAVFDEKKEQSLNELLDRHGLDLSAPSQSKPDTTHAESMLEMFRPVDDIPRFVGDLAEWMDKNSAKEHHGGLADLRSVGSVSVEGDVAKAVALTDRGEFPIEFQKVGKAWLLHFPDDAVDDAGLASSPRRGTVIDPKGTVTGKTTGTLSASSSEPSEPFKQLELLTSVEADDSFHGAGTVAFSSDNHTFVTGGNAPKIWKLGAKVPEYSFARVYPPPGLDVDCHVLAISPNGRDVALGATDGGLAVFNINTKKQLRDLKPHANGIVSISYSADGTTLLTSGYDATVKVLNAETGAVIAEMNPKGEYPDYALSAGLTCNGKWVVSVGEDALLWDALSGERVGSFNLSERRDTRLYGLAISPDGKFVATGEMTVNHHPAALIWSIADRKLVATFEHRFLVMKLAYSPDGKLLATCGIDSEAYIWRLADSRCVQTIKETEFDSIRNVAWSPNGKFLGLVCEGTVRIFGPADTSESAS